MSICAGIVLYNPDIDRLKENIEAIISQVGSVVLVDNGSDNLAEIRTLIQGFDSRLHIMAQGENKGIAAALNKILKYSSDNEYQWVITLDQDSVCPENIIKEYNKYIHLDDVAMIASRVVDRNANKLEDVSGDELQYLDRCITSATLNRVSALLDVGGFDERLFIDFVDYDMCTRLRLKGYKIARHNGVKLLHEIGKSKDVKLFGRSFVVYNHSPMRRYYYTRNVLYYMKKYKEHINYKKERNDFIVRTMLVIIYEKNKWKNLKSIFKGIRDYKKLLA